MHVIKWKPISHLMLTAVWPNRLLNTNISAWGIISQYKMLLMHYIFLSDIMANMFFQHLNKQHGKLIDMCLQSKIMSQVRRHQLSVSAGAYFGRLLLKIAEKGNRFNSQGKGQSDDMNVVFLRIGHKGGKKTWRWPVKSFLCTNLISSSHATWPFFLPCSMATQKRWWIRQCVLSAKWLYVLLYRTCPGQDFYTWLWFLVFILAEGNDWIVLWTIM